MERLGGCCSLRFEGSVSARKKKTTQRSTNKNHICSHELSWHKKSSLFFGISESFYIHLMEQMNMWRGKNVFASRVTNHQELRQLYVYVVRQPFFGYPDPTDLDTLKRYTRSEVESAVMNAFDNKVFLLDAVTRDVQVLIVPDNWNHRLPSEARIFAPTLKYIPFSFILYPDVTDRKERKMLMAPPPEEAARRIILKELDPSGAFPNGSFQLNQVGEDDLLLQFQGLQLGGGRRKKLPSTTLRFLRTPTGYRRWKKRSDICVTIEQRVPLVHVPLVTTIKSGDAIGARNGKSRTEDKWNHNYHSNNCEQPMVHGLHQRNA